MTLHLIIVLVLSLLLVMFTFQNPHPVQLNFVGWGVKEFPLIAVILLSALGGVIATTLMSIKNSCLQKKTIHELEAELEELKRPPAEIEEEELP